MIAHYMALIRRELWEHRAIFVTPLVIGTIVTLGTLTALMFVGDFQKELNLSLIHISEPTRPPSTSRMPSSA